MFAAPGAVAVLALAGGNLAASAASPSRGPSREVRQCVRGALELGSAHAQTGSVSRRTLREFSLLGTPARPDVRAPATRMLAAALAHAGARSFDPRAIRLLASVGAERVYLIAATIAPPVLPRRCRATGRLAGLSAYVHLMALLEGAGPGVCVLALPGNHAAEAIGGTSGYCLADRRLIGYLSATARIPVGSGKWLTLVPDGIRSLRLRFRHGAARVEAVRHNLAAARPLPTFTVTEGASPASFAALARHFERRLARLSPRAILYTTAARRTLGPYRPRRGFFALAGRAEAFLVEFLTPVSTAGPSTAPGSASTSAPASSQAPPAPAGMGAQAISASTR